MHSLLKKLERVVGRLNLREESRKRWKDAVPRFITQSKLEKRNRGVSTVQESCVSDSIMGQ